MYAKGCFLLRKYKPLSRSIAPESADALKYRACQQHLANWNPMPDPPDPIFPTDPAEATFGSAARTPRSTRAGGQDDGS